MVSEEIGEPKAAREKEQANFNFHTKYVCIPCLCNYHNAEYLIS